MWTQALKAIKQAIASLFGSQGANKAERNCFYKCSRGKCFASSHQSSAAQYKARGCSCHVPSCEEPSLFCPDCSHHPHPPPQRSLGSGSPWTLAFLNIKDIQPWLILYFYRGAFEPKGFFRERKFYGIFRVQALKRKPWNWNSSRLLCPIKEIVTFLSRLWP